MNKAQKVNIRAIVSMLLFFLIIILFLTAGFRSPRSVATLLPTAHSTHIFVVLVFATQSPYLGNKNVANLSRYAKFPPETLKIS
ncbi:hypothetical protein FACS1894164_02590 [Spirochaetia bacterium]|nr:hypothetical protein FACS1894164_02590 [Spirochaetia bacterium]